MRALIFILSVAAVLMPTVRAQSSLNGQEYAFSISAKSLRSHCSALMPNYIKTFDPAYASWAELNQTIITEQRRIVASGLPVDDTIQAYENRTASRTVRGWSQLAQDKKIGMCLSFYTIAAMTGNPKPLKATQPPQFKLLCKLPATENADSSEFAVDVYLESSKIGIAASELDADITADFIRWKVAIRGEIFTYYISRLTGSLTVSTSEFPSLRTGSCNKAPDRLF